MKVYRLVMRRSIVTLLVHRLKECCDIELPGGARSIEGFSNHELGSLLSLGSDPRLDELSGALDRLQNGTFGKCSECKSRIGWSLLLRDPVRRVCPDCEQPSRSMVCGLSASGYPGIENTPYTV
jgi:hypothetical protein